MGFSVVVGSDLGFGPSLGSAFSEVIHAPENQLSGEKDQDQFAAMGEGACGGGVCVSRN